MMNELLVVFYLLATLAIAYLWFYPKVVGDNVKLMMWVDVVVTAIPVAISALLFGQSDPVFSLFGLELNWFFYTVIVMFLIEMPIFFLYLKARGLGSMYWEAYRASLGFAPKGSPDSGWSTASVKEVEKQLNDTKWDGLRTPGAKRALLIGSNAAILFGTGVLLSVGDNAWSAYSLIHILLIFVSWFLLRQSVRLIADAPEEALDERMIRQRDRSYLVAYRWLSGVGAGMVTALMIYSVFTDAQTSSDGFNYQLAFTWPQVQATFWLVLGYSFMLPSMAMISLELKKGRGQR
jgi:hypothetical protein